MSARSIGAAPVAPSALGRAGRGSELALKSGHGTDATHRLIRRSLHSRHIRGGADAAKGTTAALPRPPTAYGHENLRRILETTSSARSRDRSAASERTSVPERVDGTGFRDPENPIPRSPATSAPAITGRTTTPKPDDRKKTNPCVEACKRSQRGTPFRRNDGGRTGESRRRGSDSLQRVPVSRLFRTKTG